MINIKVSVKELPNINLDLTEEFKEATNIIASEIRGNIKRGTNIEETVSHRLNSPKYRQWKLTNLGEGRPLVAKEKKLIDPASYPVKKVGRNHVRVMLSNARHPGSNASIAEIGAYNNFGTSRIPAREFWGVSKTAVKRVIAFITDRVAKLVDGQR